ncbi:MAG TPA: hypothetical protein VNZ53_12820, partial [Steroidobacteraceae bacterium]|nr:hypothetical protein [Steroidobacteraceae bacterium]
MTTSSIEGRPRLTAPASELSRSGVGFQLFGFLAGRDAHDLDRIADRVGGALLASGSAWHHGTLI